MSGIVVDRPRPQFVYINGRTFELRARWPEQHLGRIDRVSIFEGVNPFGDVDGEWVDYDKACAEAVMDLKRRLNA